MSKENFAVYRIAEFKLKNKAKSKDENTNSSSFYVTREYKIKTND